MRRLNRQDGVGLVVLLALITALSIGAVGLVLLVSNSMGFTRSDNQRQKAFNVAEGALNVGMATLQSEWPSSAALTPVFPTSTFRSQYPASTFPDPASGDFITVSFFDNSPSAAGGAISPGTSPNWDSNGDNEMYIRTTARVGNRMATVQGLVQRTFWNPTLPRGIAVYSGGDIVNNGQGNTLPKITNDIAPPPASAANPIGQAQVYVVGDMDAGMTQAGAISVNQGSSVPDIDTIVSPTVISGIVSMAKMGDRYFSGVNAASDAENSPQSKMGGPGLQGLTVIDPASGTSGTIPLPGNTESTPAVLFVLGDSTTQWNFKTNGTVDSYGFFFTRWGGTEVSKGTSSVYGTLVAAGSVGFDGTPNVIYDDLVWSQLLQQWTLNVKLVPNTWRELSPGATD